MTAIKDQNQPTPRTIPTATALRSLEYHSPLPGFHSHGRTLVPTDGCAACAELRRRASSAEIQEIAEAAPQPEG